MNLSTSLDELRMCLIRSSSNLVRQILTLDSVLAPRLELQVHENGSHVDGWQQQPLQQPFSDMSYPQLYDTLPQPYVSPVDNESSEDTSSTVNNNINIDSNLSAQILLQALQNSGRCLALAADSCKQERHLQALEKFAGLLHQNTLPQLQGTDTSSSHDIQRIRQLIDTYTRLKEQKQQELKIIQDMLNSLQSCKLQPLNPEHLRDRDKKALSNATYDAILYGVYIGSDHIVRDYMLPDHPTVSNVEDLVGTIYVLKVDKSAKRPPQVGHKFHAYESHYASKDRTTPVICKVKEMDAIDDPNKIFRLYHFYKGSKKRKRQEAFPDNRDTEL